MSSPLAASLFVNSTSHHAFRREARTVGACNRHCVPHKDTVVALSANRGERTASPASRPRRAFLLCAALVLGQLRGGAGGRAGAYSSPYLPGKQADAPLPPLLYEEAVEREVKTASGLRYFDLSVGSGPEARPGAAVSVNYTSRLSGLYGTKLDSTFDHPSAAPFLFVVGEPGMVPGFNEAVVGMRAGGKRRALLSADIAYVNPDAKPPVREFFARRRLLSVLNTNRDASIVFDIELLNVK